MAISGDKLARLQTWLRKENLMRETESLLMTAHNKAIKTNLI